MNRAEDWNRLPGDGVAIGQQSLDTSSGAGGGGDLEAAGSRDAVRPMHSSQSIATESN